VIFKVTPRFWKNFKKLTPQQRERAREKYKLFKVDPFDSRLGTHQIERLSSLIKKTVWAVEIESNLRALFIKEGEIVTTLDIGTHDIYKAKKL
jgi:hypothetical protein